MSVALPNSSAFKRKLSGLFCGVSLLGAATLVLALSGLLRLTAEEWMWALAFTGGYTLLLSVALVRGKSRSLTPIAAYLDRRSSASEAGEDWREAFSAVVNLPRKLATAVAAGWVATCGLIAISMGVRFGGFGWSEGAIVMLSGVAGGFVLATLMAQLVKRNLGEICGVLAVEVSDPDVRRSLVTPISLRTKILHCVVGMSVVSLLFAMLLFATKRTEALEEFTIRLQQSVLEVLAGRLEGRALEAPLRSVLGENAGLPVSMDVTLLDPEDSGAEGQSNFDRGLLEWLQAERAAGSQSGGSASRSSDRIWAWRALSDGRFLVASMPRHVLEGDAAGAWIAFAVLLAVVLATAVVLARLLSGDIGQALESLRSAATRMAAGSFNRGESAWESDDETGEISRSFQTMEESVRETFDRLSRAVVRVESTVSEIATASERVATVTADQVRGIQQASTAMEAINSQVRGIADSSQVLNSSVEESSSSILEMGASGQDLNDTAGTLSGRVEEVSSSIEQMVRSVRQVVENAESLAEASIETSSSMDEMASSLKEVDETAEASALLSQEVVAAAEIGQQKVRQTIEGMDAIRVATETAEQVIRNLGGRTKEIGAVVDVIDDVADETNLLALNAAIIAAQAGEHGKAFSVVADEIKDLADRVLASTKEIGVLIRSVQEEGSNAIGAIEKGTESVASGVDLSAEAGISLEGITRASKDSGRRIQEILSAVRGQSRAASHVVELMERVRGGVEEIRSAAQEQERGNTVVFSSATTMRDVAQQVRGTTEEQARGSSRIRESVEGVRDAVEQINGALQEQSAACRSAVEFLEQVYTRTQSNEESANQIEQATKGLLEQTADLRNDLQRFRL